MRQNQETTPEATEQENLDALDEGFELGMDEEKQQDGKQNEPERQEQPEQLKENAAPEVPFDQAIFWQSATIQVPCFSWAM